MFRGGRNSRYKGGNSNRTTQLRGLFADGIWQCDCDPRLPAERFKVKKEGKNHGRWFYTCQKAQDERCGFFLWDEDAKPREESAVLNNSRTEKSATKVNGEEANPIWKQEQLDVAPAAPKRKASPIALSDTSTDIDGGVNDDDLISWPATAAQDPSTPRKAIKSDAYATPATSRIRRLPWLDYTDDDAAAEGTPSKAPATFTQSSHTISLPTPDHTKTDPSSPTRSRFRDALSSPPPADSLPATLTAEVMTLLSAHSVNLPQKTESELRAALARYELRLQGAVKGREMVRAALRSRDNKVVQLQARIAGAEAEAEVLRRGLTESGAGGHGELEQEHEVLL